MFQNRYVATVALLALITAAMVPGCILPDLGASLNTTPNKLDYGTDKDLINLVVNLNPSGTPLSNPITVLTNKSWIVPLDCTTVGDACFLENSFDSITIPVRIDRSMLALGENKGKITLRTNSASDYVVDVIAEDTLETNFYVDNQVPDIGESVRFTDATRTSETSGPVIERIWDFGDGTTSTAKNPVHAFLNPGFYKISLKVTTSNDQETRIRPAYIVVGGTTAGVDFIASATTVFENDAITFTDVSNVSANVTGRLWDFGVTNLSTSDQSTEESPVYRYQESGIYTVTLTLMTDTGNLLATKEEYILVQSQVAPRANFSVQGGTSINAGTPIQFLDQSEPGTAPIEYLWDFGDGTTSDEQNPIHTYNIGGVFNVSLTVVSDHGTDTKVKQVTSVVTPPEASFEAGPTYLDMSTTFSNTSTLGSGTLVSYAWTFGDGGTSSGANPSHTYQNLGDFNVSLTVTTTHGTNTANQIVTVTYEPPTAVITAPNGGQPGQPVSFSSASSTGGAAPLSSWLWDFGDGTTSALQNPVHTYDALGTYTVTLTVSNSLPSSNSDTTTQQINIVNPPTAAFEVDNLSAVTTVPVGFLNRTIPGTELALTYLWDFGDGTTSSSTNPTHQYYEPGRYTVTLTVGSPSSNPQIATNRITVDLPPTPDFTASPRITTTSYPIQFTDDSDDEGARPILGRLWDFGDGSVGTNINPRHSYTEEGAYDVSLSVTFTHSATNELLSVARTRENYIYITQLDLKVNTTDDVLDGDTSSSGALNINPGPDGRVSLREAITAANNTPGEDTIEFDLEYSPTEGIPSIRVRNTPLPSIGDTSGGLSIDGRIPMGYNVILSGANLSTGNGLTITSANNSIDGLTIQSFPINGISIAGEAADNNQIGTTVGNIFTSNRLYAVQVSGNGADRNSILNNEFDSNIRGNIELVDGANEDMPTPAITSHTPLSGTTEPNATVQIYYNYGTGMTYLLETITADENGNFTDIYLDFTSDYYAHEIPAGYNGSAYLEYTFYVTATDTAGNTSSFSAPYYLYYLYDDVIMMKDQVGSPPLPQK